MPTEKFESVEVPFNDDGDGRRYLTAKQLLEDPELDKFVKRYQAHFETDLARDRLYFIAEPVKNPDA